MKKWQGQTLQLIQSQYQSEGKEKKSLVTCPLKTSLNGNMDKPEKMALQLIFMQYQRKKFSNLAPGDESKLA